tara:strand:- start:654423 stop:658901 length:4479 start_codon:yes stop_codon:yes gene_type:complete
MVSIGHRSARFEDVTLPLTDDADQPTNSVIWLRNGGGKTSLLSLFFAGVYPGRRDFLGKRAGEKVRTLENYVGANDHSAVVCEWSLDDENSLFDNATRYLSGVFYQRGSGSSGDDESKVVPLFFAMKAIDDKSELTLDGLPLMTNDTGKPQRRSLSGFRLRMRELQDEYPQAEVFLSSHQNEFRDELESRGIDPRVFYYQIRMNEREGGVSERFSFSEDEEFVDFLLDMAFKQDRAQEVKDQISTFRVALVQRNEQLKPELECCRGLQTRMQKLIAVHGERDTVFLSSIRVRQLMRNSESWISESQSTEQSKLEQLSTQHEETTRGLAEATVAVDQATRLAAVYRLEGCRIQHVAAEAIYADAKKQWQDLEYKKRVWAAAGPLSRAIEAERLANEYRETLARKQTQFAPDLDKLKADAEQYAMALRHEVSRVTSAEAEEQQNAKRFEEAAEEASAKATSFAQQASTQETFAAGLQGKIDNVATEFERLRSLQAVLPSESGADESLARLSERLDGLIESARRHQSSLDRVDGEIVDETKRQDIRIETKAVLQRERDELQLRLNDAKRRRSEIEADERLRKLLDTEQVDLLAAIQPAIKTATAETKRLRDEIIRIRLSAVEDERAIAWLRGDGDLLPPTRDVEAVLNWLRSTGVVAWSGWQYLSQQNKAERRQLVERYPHIATGIVVADQDYDDVVGRLDAPDLPQLTSAFAILPAGALLSADEVDWAVIGPASDAHFDSDAAAMELIRLEQGESQRSDETSRLQTWLSDLDSLLQALESFRADYPAGWFDAQSQRLEVATAKFDDVLDAMSKGRESLEQLSADRKTIAGEVADCLQAQKECEKALALVTEFKRQHGDHEHVWRKQKGEADRRAESYRKSEVREGEKADDARGSVRACLGRQQNLTAEKRDRDRELAALKYIDRDSADSAPGSLDQLKANYDLRVAEYEQKVNEDYLAHAAIDKEKEAKEQFSEFDRVRTKDDPIDEDVVRRELAALPENIPVAIQLEQVDEAAAQASRRLGPLTNQHRPIHEAFEAAVEEAKRLSASSPLPDVELSSDADANLNFAEQYDAQVSEQRELCKSHEAKLQSFETSKLTLEHSIQDLSRDLERIKNWQSSYADILDRIVQRQNEVGPTVDESTCDLPTNARAALLNSIENDLAKIRQSHRELDARRHDITTGVHGWARQTRFTELPNSVASNFLRLDAAQLERKAQFHCESLDNRVTEIERKLAEANQHRDRVIDIILSAVDEGLGLLRRVSNMSRLPSTLPQAGKQFLQIETSAPENPDEKRGRIGGLIDELLDTGDLGEGLGLIKKAVRRVAGRIRVSILHPDLYSGAKRMNMAEMQRLSDGERLTCAILLYCALMKLRQADNHRKGSSVLVLDNPIGTASRVSFLNLQREVARAMKVQLIYATGIKDLNAIGALENVVRLRNSRQDRRTGRRVVEIDDESTTTGQIDVARIVFDRPPSFSSNADEATEMPASVKEKVDGSSNS